MGLNLKTIDRICIAVVVLTTVLLGVWLLRHGVAQERLLRQGKQRVARSMEDMRLAERNIERLKASARTTADEMARIVAQIPENAEIGNFLVEVDRAVKKRGLVLVSVQPQPLIKEKLYQKIPVGLSCKGSFVSLYGFLQDLEKMDRFTMVKKMVMGKAAESGQCELDLNLLLFVREPRAVKS